MDSSLLVLLYHTELNFTIYNILKVKEKKYKFKNL